MDKDKLLPTRSPHITDRVKRCKMQPKINKLKRIKSTGGSGSNWKEVSLSGIKETGSASCCEADSNNEFNVVNRCICPRIPHTSTKNTKENETEENTKLSGPKLDIVPMTGPFRQTRKADTTQRLSVVDPKPVCIDLCKEKEENVHKSSPKFFPMFFKRHTKEDGRHRDCDNEPNICPLSPTAPQTSIQRSSDSDHSFYQLPPTSKSHREMKSGIRKEFSDNVRNVLLDQIQARNRRFPVRSFFSALLQRRNEVETGCESSGAVKRKQDADDHEDDRRPNKRHRWNREQNSYSVSVLPQKMPEDLDGSNVGLTSSSSRLSVSRRRKQKPEPPTLISGLVPVEPVLESSAVGEDYSGAGEVDVLWTEKYQPRHSSKIVGNSTSVKKLESWLKKWKIRADVEERRKRREERRTQEDNCDSWDCGNFEGELEMQQCKERLCNTVLIQGPTGVGKTASVYACAHQLGFKVLEVNSSALRSGRLVLSQLKEATQSHQVGAPHSLTPKSDSSHCQNSHLDQPPAPNVCRKETSRSIVISSRNLPLITRLAVKKRAAAASPSHTITHFLRNTKKKSSDDLQDTRVTDVCGTAICTQIGCNDEGSSNEPALAEGQKDGQKSTPAISLILFEEVDVIFEEDVGFLTAIKTLMSTSKRPVILTTSDPYFSLTLDVPYEKILFKTPNVDDVWSFLQCVCLVESVRTDPTHIECLLDETRGDVRRSALQLEMWSRSGGGETHFPLKNRITACSSWSELEHLNCLDVLARNWQKGQSLLHAKLDVVVAPPTQNHMLGTFQKVLGKNLDSFDPVIREPKRNGKKRTKTSSSPVEAENLRLDPLWRFLDSMSFLDSHFYKRLPRVTDWAGVKVRDSLVDDLPEEEVEGRFLERSCEMLAVAEALSFHRCRTEVRKSERNDGEVNEEERECWTSGDFIAAVGGDVCTSMEKKLCEQSFVQKKSEIACKLLSSKAFLYHGNKKAVVMDYLPVLRTMCRLEMSKLQHPKPRTLHYLSDINPPFPKSTLRLLTTDLL